ncbi:extracellular solute-binding protein [Streptosporangium canum]|uniref:Extracellular solute-binding protein n=1 Tax=Streptosporangium canum TaxID=324952 RepID=A0A1I3FDL0_9ACTN|nr:extracellular solute-binding protein [Streptosporangium canum]
MPSSGRHRVAPGAETRRGQVRLRLSLAAVAAAVALTGSLVLALGPAEGRCSPRDPVLVGVAAAVDIAPTVMEAAGRFNRSRTGVDGRCVLVQVTEQPPATVLRTLIGGTAGVLSERPDGWITDSSAWIRLARKQGAGNLAGTETVMATSPLVFATRKSLAQRFAVGKTDMNWRMVFPATTRGRIRPNADEPDVVRVPDPSLAGAGIATVAAARDVVGTGAEADRSLTAFVRWAQAGSAPDYRSMLAAVDDRSFWQRPVVIVPEQSVWTHNRLPSGDPVVALHPREGTINLDYPYVVTSADSTKASGSRAFATWLRSPETQDAVRRAGFRSADGAQGPYSPGPEIPTEAPRTRPAILPAMIDEALEAWSRLAPPTNILVLADTGKHMAQPIKGEKGRTKLTVALEAARLGLQLFPNSTHMGMWEFAAAKGKDHRERVRLGPILEPDGGQVIRRSRLEELTRTLRADPKLPSSLYDSILAGFREVTDSYDEGMNNTLLVITAGRDDAKGLSSGELAERLRDEWDPVRPVQIVVLAFGDDLDRAALGQVTGITNGSLHIAREPNEIIDVFLSALARRLCHPTCPKAP